jgi:hypothetical protein
MSRFFQPIEFPVEPDQVLARPTETVWNASVVELASTAILAEIEKLKAGTSEYSVYAIDPGKHGFPAVNALKAFVKSPSDKLLKNFEETANSTFGARAGKAFTAHLRNARETREVTHAQRA